MWISKSRRQTGRASLCRAAPLCLGLSLALLPQSALAQNTDLTSDLSDVFGVQETPQTAQTSQTGQTPDQTAAQNRGEHGAAANIQAADTGADITSTASGASETSTPASEPLTGAGAIADAQNTAAGSASSQSAALSAPAGVDEAGAEGTAGVTSETTGGAPQSSIPAGQSPLEGPAAAPLTAPAQAGNSREATGRDQADNTRAAAQVWDARTGIVTPGTAGRVVHVFGASIPTLVCQPGMVCLMELEAGEEVLDTPIQADPARWRVELRHRDTPVSQTYFAFKPSEDAAPRTNFIVLTDRRVYVVNLVKDLRHSTYILSFDYPDTRARALAAEIKARATARRAASAAAHSHRTRAIARSGVATTRGAVPASELDFNYSIRGTAPFKPLRIYNDGRKTYVDLPGRYRGDLPVVIGGTGEDNKAFNYRVGKGGTQFIIDRVLRDFVLQDGRRSIRIRRGS